MYIGTLRNTCGIASSGIWLPEVLCRTRSARIERHRRAVFHVSPTLVRGPFSVHDVSATAFGWQIIFLLAARYYELRALCVFVNVSFDGRG